MLVGMLIDVGTSVSFPIYARLQEARDEAVRVFRSVLSATSAIVIPVFGLIAALAPTLVADVLGSQWGGSAPVLRVLALVSILTILGDVTAPLWQGMGQPWRNAMIEGIQFALLLPAVWWLTGEVGVVGAALAWIPAVVVSQIISAVFLPRVLPRPFAGLTSVCLAIAVASGMGVVAAIWVDAQTKGLFGALAAIVAGASLCFGTLWIVDSRLDLGLGRALIAVFPQLDRSK